MKTTLEWFSEFPEPYKSQAIANCPNRNLTRMHLEPIDALCSGFVWDETKQGHEYWSDFNLTLLN